jgi:hypothetical protein
MHSYSNSRWKGLVIFMPWQLYSSIRFIQYLPDQGVARAVHPDQSWAGCT